MTLAQDLSCLVETTLSEDAQTKVRLRLDHEKIVTTELVIDAAKYSRATNSASFPLP